MKLSITNSKWDTTNKTNDLMETSTWYEGNLQVYTTEIISWVHQSEVFLFLVNKQY